MIDADPFPPYTAAPAERVEYQVRALAERARLGDADAFSQIVTALHPRVFRWALTFARDTEEAEEITQDTFILVYRKLDQFRGNSALEGWVYLIARNVALARHRKARRRKSLYDAVPGGDDVYVTDPGARVDRQRVAEYIRHFFRALPPRQREVFDLVDLQGFDPVEVAAMIGAKPATVRGNLFKARSSIRARILSLHPAWQELRP